MRPEDSPGRPPGSRVASLAARTVRGLAPLGLAARVSSLPLVGARGSFRSPLARSEALATLAPRGSRVVTPAGRCSRLVPLTARSFRGARYARASRLACRRSLRSLLAVQSGHRSPIRGAPGGRASRLPLARSAALPCSRLPAVALRTFGGLPSVGRPGRAARRSLVRRPPFGRPPGSSYRYSVSDRGSCSRGPAACPSVRRRRASRRRIGPWSEYGTHLPVRRR